MTRAAQRIRAFLHERDRTQTSLAAELHITRQQLGNILRGMAPSNETLVRIRIVEGLEDLAPEDFCEEAA